ncbi:pre-mRNA cleavage complex II Clp1 [Pseudohyphozyma bogoriensis]|nr:pre-mRNA cleavage complex II Clp1 [Pseudohyphozyma bogoriensis]
MMDPPKRRLTLPPLHEFRFELEQGEALAITLLQGTAEVFGFELVKDLAHPFGDEARAAVWSPNGAEIEMSPCHSETSYLATESPLPTYLSLHLSLSRLRLLSRPSSADLSQPDNEIQPPRVMVVGERGSGKTSLIKTLVNWRVREMIGKGYEGDDAGVVYVNLDVGEGGVTMPGTCSITKLHSPLPTTTTVSPLGTSASSGPPVPFPLPTASGSTPWTPAHSIDAYAPPVNPLVFWHGHTTPNINPKLYEVLLKSVGRRLRAKFAESEESWRGGCLVDTPGEWAEKKGMSAVTRAVRELEVNILLVVGNERLHVEMKKLLSTNKTVTVVRVPKSDGASDSDLPYQVRLKDAQIRSYFYGGPALTQGVLSPFSIIVKFDDLKIFRVGEAAETQAPSTALPLGFSRAVGDTELLAIDLLLPRTSSELLNKILAIPQASDDAGDEEIVQSPAVGFVYVSAIDQTKKKVTLLSPLPGRLPRKTLLLASLDWQDS